MRYELDKTDTIHMGSHTLYRIVAAKAFGNVQPGDRGGYIESERNLAQDSNAWVYDTAVVSGNAKVYGNAKVCGHACVCGDAVLCGDAMVDGA